MTAFSFIDVRSGFEPEILLVEIPEKMHSKTELFNFLAARLHFPSYFGKNWDALDECLRDLSWLSASKVILWHRDIPLSAESKEREIYLKLLKGLCEEGSDVPIEVVFPVSCRKDVELMLE